MRLLRRSSWRHFTRHPAQLGLAVLGVALGVAVVLALDLAVASALRAFELTAETLAGRATHRIASRDGIEPALYRRLRSGLGLHHAAPGVFETVTVITPADRHTVTLLGIDPFAEAGARPWLAFASEDHATPLDVASLLARPGAMVATAGAAARLGLQPGAQFTVQAGGVSRAGHLVGLLQPRDAAVARGLEAVLIADLSTADEILGRGGRLDAIDLRFEGAQAPVLQAVRGVLDPDTTLEPAGARRGTLGALTRAFRLNLQALSLLALLVGGFLVFNAVQFAVVQRRPSIGVLRALGATRSQVFSWVLVEACAMAAAGTGVGLLLGPWLARSLLGLVAQTINDHYATVVVTGVHLPPGSFGKALALGLLVGTLAALVPAREATRVPAREALARSWLEHGFRHRMRRAIPWAAFLGATGIALLLPGGALAPAYGGLFLILLAAACLVPVLCRLLLRGLGALLGRLVGVTGRLAAHGAAATLSRTAVATAALMLAVAASVGLGTMIASFRDSVSTWLETTLRADVYVRVPAHRSARTRARIEADVAARLAATPGIAESVAYQRVTVPARRGGRELGDLELVALRTGPAILGSYEALPGSRGLEAVATPGTAMISEPLAWRLELEVGDRLELQGRGGWHELEVIAVYRDFASETGVLIVDRDATFRPRWPDRSEGISSLALFADPGTDADTLAARLQDRATDLEQQLSIVSNRGLRTASLAVFDRTFAITGALRGLCLLVAFLGIWSALMALQLDRIKEIGILKALGAVPRQIAGLVLAQSGLLGLCAGVLAIPVGTLLGWVLIAVINRRSFGWTLLEHRLPATVVLEAVVLATVAALLAGAYPAWRFARTVAADALREDG